MYMFLLTVLISANLASIMVPDVLGQTQEVDELEDARPKDFEFLENEKFADECIKELDITYHFTRKNGNSGPVMISWIPGDRLFCCLLDCYYHKMGILIQKNETSEGIPIYSIAKPPDFNDYKFPLSPYDSKVHLAMNLCKLLFKTHGIMKCDMIQHYRYCIDNHMTNNFYESPISSRIG